MPLRTSVLVALIPLALGLVGQHPCSMAPVAATSNKSACHETPDQDSSDAGDCAANCEKACRPSMVLTSRLPATGAPILVLDAPRAVASRTLPLVAHAIDHIPLA